MVIQHFNMTIIYYTKLAEIYLTISKFEKNGFTIYKSVFENSIICIAYMHLRGVNLRY